MLLAGLLATVVFALLHTASIAGVFPVLKTLLEEEGVEGWVNRTIAGERVGIEFNPLSDESRIEIRATRLQSEEDTTALRPGDAILPPDGQTAVELLHTMGALEPGATITVTVETRDGRIQRTLTADTPDFSQRMMRSGLRAVLAVLPDDMDTQDGKLRTLVHILIGLVLIVFIGNAFRYAGEILIATAILRSMMDLRAKLYAQTLHLPLSFFAEQPTSDVVTRFVQDIQEVQRGLTTFFGKFLREPLKAMLILCLAFTLDWRITLTMVVVAPITVGVFWAVGRKVKKAARRLLQGYGYMIDALTTSLQNLRVVKAYTAEDQEHARLRVVDRHMFKQQLKLAKLHAFVSPTVETLAVVAGSIVTVWLAGRVLNHELSLSKFVQLGVTLGMLFDPLRRLTDVYVRVKRSTAGVDRILTLLAEPVETDEQETANPVGPLENGIEFVGVSFTYPGAERPALVDINLSVAKGETMAVVGPNGCGKTTLVSMLPRLLVPGSGEVRYDGANLQDIQLRSLRKQIGVVTQEAVVFAGTPAMNIAYGNGDPVADKVEDAARRAYADEFIRDIPGGYDADLGERGTTLSGGQRQRLAIARAIYRNAPILIFDEATSQIDSESELKIQTALQEFAKDRTTFIIAHRLSTIQFANRIIVMEAGRIIDSGGHKELFDRCDLYRTLCQTQFLAEPAEPTP